MTPVLDLLFGTIAILGGLSFVVLPSTATGRRMKPWMTRALSLAGLCLMLWGFLCQLPVFIPHEVFRPWNALATNLRVGLGGAAMGLILFAFLSPAARKKPGRGPA